MGIDWKEIKRKQGKGKKSAEIEEFESSDEEISTASFGLAKSSKQTVSIRLDNEIVYYFKSLGPGYQTRINEVLLQFVRAQKLASKNSKPAYLDSLAPSPQVRESATYQQDNNLALLQMLYFKDPNIRQTVDDCAVRINKAIKSSKSKI